MMLKLIVLLEESSTTVELCNHLYYELLVNKW